MQPCYPLRAHRTAAVCLLKPILGLLIFIVAPLLLSPAAALAQTPGASGSITGRVQNVTSGSYLNNARVRVLGTNLEAFTNSSGEYQLSGVPEGETTLQVFYTGLAQQTATVQVPAGETVRQDFDLRRARAQADEAVVLDRLQVSSNREYNAQAIAINEQRFAPNPKNVISTDAFGEINQGNIGEFLKHVPGVTI